MDTDQLREESNPADIPGLVAQARSAYQQNRIKECLALTRAALLVDPGNTAAIELQSAVRFDMQRDLSDARALIEESRNKPEAAKYRKAAEIILRKALYLDPESEGAKTLLSSIRSVTDTPAAPLGASIAPVPAEKSYASSHSTPVTQAPAATVAGALESASYTSVMVEEPPVEYTVPGVSESPFFVASPAAPEQAVVFEGVSAAHSEANGSNYGSSYITQPEIREPEAIPFTTGTTFVDKNIGKETKSSLTLPIVIVSIAVLVGGFLLFRQRLGLVQAAAPVSTSSNTGISDSSASEDSAASARQVSYPTATTAPTTTATAPGAAASTATRPSSLSSSPSSSLPAPANSAKTAPPALAALNVPAGPGVATSSPAPAASSRTAAASAPGTGSLAVSSVIAAEIYMADKYMGSTPTTLQLPAGSQTLEFRHGDLRTTITHVVKANETTTALVTFDVKVQVNARPWANVFIEGTPRLSLGQTPLSDVQLPIGSVLIFENPNFPSKSHKIVLDDKTIQVTFQ